MAGSAIFSGTVRFSATSTLNTRQFSALLAFSAQMVHQFVINNGLSDHVVSLDTMSNPSFIAMFATGRVRVNYAGEPSSVSAGSAGREFQDLWAQVGSGISGPLAFHFANSSGDSATVTMLLAMPAG